MNYKGYVIIFLAIIYLEAQNLWIGKNLREVARCVNQWFGF